MTNTLLPPPLPIAEAIERDVTTDPRLKSVHSIRQYRSDLLHFEAWRNGRALTKSLVEDYAAALHREGYAPASINQRLAAVRWWVRRLIDHAEDDLEDTPKTRKEIRRASRVLIVRGVTGQRPPRGRYLSPEEIKSLLDVCASDPAPAGARDGAMFAVALSVGLRQGDITSLQMEDIRNNTGESCDLVVHGKGDRVDTLYLYKGGYKRLMAWLALRGQDPGHVFCPIRKNDKINTRGRLSQPSLKKILDFRQIALSIPEHLTFHDFRKTFACTMLEDHDLATVQKLMRHKSPATTSNIYDIRDEKTKRAAVQTLEIGE